MVKRVTRSSVFGITAVAALFSLSAQAQNVSSEQLAACAQIENPLQRLVCFDKLVAGEKYNPARSMAAAPVAQPATSNKSQFGLEHRADADSSSDIMYIEIASSREDSYGKWVITLANGQVWQQTDSQSFRLNANDQYYIERGLLNSFYLGREGQNRRIQVKRVE